MRVIFLLGCLMWGLAGLSAEPELDFVYPAGGRPESEFDVEVGGAMRDITYAVVSGEGVKTTLLGAPREVTYSKKGKPVVTLVPNRYRFKVTVEKDAKPGIRTFRVGTAYRLSEPLRFEVSSMPETCEAFTNRAVASEVSLETLPVCLNGRIRGAGADRYRFQASKGMTLVAFTEGRVLPRGAFRPELWFADAAGNPCDGVKVYDAATAPVAVFAVPQDGTYELRVADVSGKGSNGSVYRIKLGELPLVTGFSPMGARAGESLNVNLTGVNLAQKRVRLFTGGKNGDLCLEALKGEAFVLPRLRFDLSEEPDVAKMESNGTGDAGQPLEWPCVVNGVLAAPSGHDVYRFEGRKGDALYVDARAELLGSPLKPRVTIRGRGGEVVASGCFDTNANVRAAICGRDPSVALMVPEDGTYELDVSDLDGRNGEALVYRLRVGPPQPDYQLWMTPASLNIPSDGSMLVTLHLNRIHGFDGEVRVGLEYPPLSIACEGGLVSAGEVTGKMTVSTDGVRFPRTVFGLSLTGTAQVDGRDVRRPAVPFVFGRDPDGKLARCAFQEVSAKVGYGARALRIDQPAKTAVPVGVKEPVRLTVLSTTLATHLGGLYVPTVVWPPHGFTVTGVQPTNKQERAGVLLQADGSVMKPAQKGFVILGCYVKGDTNKTVSAVTQSVPYVIK